MCRRDSDITPTRHTVYLRKTTKSKVAKAKSVTRFVVRGSSSSEDSSEDCSQDRCKYIFRCKSSSEVQKQGKKQGKCTCGRNCGKDSADGKLHFRCDAKDEKRKTNMKKGFLHIKAKFGQCCHCNGGDNDGWLCDGCRAEEKKKGMWRFVARSSDSDSSSYGSHDYEDSSSGCDCGDDDGQFAKECEAWMKAAAKKRKNEQKDKDICNCYRPGCKICLIVNC